MPDKIFIRSAAAVITTLLFVFMQPAYCQQHGNAIKLETGGFTIPGARYMKPSGPLTLMQQHGLYYERRIGGAMQLTCGLAWWNNYIGNGYYWGDIPQVTSEKTKGSEVTTITRTNYKMLDLAIQHNLFAAKRHQFVVGLGLSCAMGYDVTSTYSIPPPPPPGAIFYGTCGFGFGDDRRSVTHLGAVSSLSYDYHILKGHFAVGADIKYRKYLNLPSAQIDYGVHIGYCFGKK